MAFRLDHAQLATQLAPGVRAVLKQGFINRRIALSRLKPEPTDAMFECMEMMRRIERGETLFTVAEVAWMNNVLQMEGIN